MWLLQLLFDISHPRFLCRWKTRPFYIYIFICSNQIWKLVSVAETEMIEFFRSRQRDCKVKVICGDGKYALIFSRTYWQLLHSATISNNVLKKRKKNICAYLICGVEYDTWNISEGRYHSRMSGNGCMVKCSRTGAVGRLTV